MNNSPWARPAALTLTCALSLTLLTGCADGAAAEPPRAASTPSRSTAPVVEALSEQRLAALALTDGDLPGYRIVEPSRTQIRTALRGRDVKVAKACRPLLEANGILGDPAAYVFRSATELTAFQPREEGKLPDIDDPLRVDTTTVVLASYDGDGARRVMKGLTDGLGTCEGELGYTSQGGRATTTEVTPREALEAEGADDAVAFTLSARKQEGAAPSGVQFQVVRHGNNVITYITFNVAKSRQGTPYELDAAVVAFQSKKARERLSRG